jgi:CheY-like chemotaxis protein
VLCEILSRSGAQVCIANCGRDAIESVTLSPFDLIFQDLHLPDMDGYTTARAIRGTKNGATVPILALSASSMQNSVAQCLAAGINDFLVAPVDSQALLRMVRLWVDGDVATREENEEFDAFTYSSFARSVHASSSSMQRVIELDVDSAIARLGNDQSLYLKLLKRFLQTHPSTAQVVRKAMETRDVEAAILAAHTVASAAANIGATWLYQTAQALESSLRAGEIFRCADLLTDLEMAENGTTRSAEAYLSVHALPSNSSPVANVKGWQECARGLRTLIDAHDTAALDQLVELRGVIGGRTAGGEIFLRLEASVVAYDFDEARNHLEALIRWMQQSGALRVE